MPPEKFEFNITYYPNPFDHSITAEYTLEESLQVQIQLFNNLGQKINELTNSYQLYGKHKLELNTANLPAGIYYCWFQAGDKVVSNKIIKIN